MRNRLDQYFTPPELTMALLDRIDVSGRTIVEPCCGEGDIAKVLVDYGGARRVLASDIDPKVVSTIRDARIATRVADAFVEVQDGDLIVTNPPFSDAPKLIRSWLAKGMPVFALLRVTFVEPCSKDERSARTDLLRMLDHALVLPRTSFKRGKAGTDSTTCAWFCWHDDVPARTSMDWVTNDELDRLAGQVDLVDLIGQQVLA